MDGCLWSWHPAGMCKMGSARWALVINACRSNSVPAIQRAAPAPQFQPTSFRKELVDGKGGTACLFGVDSLRLDVPGRYAEVARERVEECSRLVGRIVGDRPGGVGAAEWARRVLRDVDEVSRLLCEVIDSAELCRSTHSGRDWRAAAGQAWAIISAYMIELNASAPLYAGLENALHAAEGSLDAVDLRMGHLQLQEFRAGGIHLPPHLSQKVTELHSRIGEASHRFLEEIHTVDQQHPFEVSAEEMVALPESVPACPSLSVRGGGTVALGQAALDGILFGCSSAEVRRRALVHHEQVAQSSLPILEELLGARHELAATLGARSFAEHALSNRVMQSPEAAMEFLRDLHGGLQPKIRQEVELLQREKAAVEGPNSGVVEESDRRYMCRRVKERLSPDGPSVTLGSCMKVLHFLTSSLWGVSLELVPLRRGEHCSPDVLKVRVTEESPEGGSARHLADVYMDLFSRSHKIGTTAAYVQQFPQHLYPQPPGVSFDQSTNDDDMHQEWSPARVTLVCHMPRAASRPVMLPLSAAETLWHEWGHVLHVVLSRTRYQHTAGTRCALDFVEMPSTLMEAFFWDPRVLAMLDRSWSPSDLRALGARRLLFSGLEAQHQIFLAMADLQLHGADPRSVDLPSSLRRVHAEFRDSPLVPRMNVAQFSHLSGYAAGYYGYLLSKVLSSNVFHQRFLQDPFSRHEGLRYRHAVLAHGGALEPLQLLSGLIQNPLDMCAYHQQHVHGFS